MTTALCPVVAFVAVASACLEVGKETPGRISADRKSAWSPTRAVLICARVFLNTLSSELSRKPKRDHHKRTKARRVLRSPVSSHYKVAIDDITLRL